MSVRTFLVTVSGGNLSNTVHDEGFFVAVP
jgi:hypothetical protein